MSALKPVPGIVIRHSRNCPEHGERTTDGRTCTAGRKGGCVPSFEAWVYDRRSKQKVRKTFPTKAAAKRWRTDAASQAQRGALQQETRESVRQVAEEWLQKARDGEVLSRSRKRYKPSVLRGYASNLRRYVYDDLGAARFSDLRRTDIQLLVDRLVGSGLSGSTVRNAIVPLQAVARYAVKRKGLLVNPTTDLELPEAGGRRDRAASPVEAAALVGALFDDERPVYATAFYAGLRRGELRALRVSDLHGVADPGRAWIKVERGWDDVEGGIDPKSTAGKREIPVPETLRRILVDHLERNGRIGRDLVFGPDGKTSFVPNNLRRRAARAWAIAAVGAFLTRTPLPVELDPIALHECRHSYSTMLDACGISETRADRYMGHSARGVAGRYRHQLAEQLTQDGARLDAYLAGASEGKVVSLSALAS